MKVTFLSVGAVLVDVIVVGKNIFVCLRICSKCAVAAKAPKKRSAEFTFFNGAVNVITCSKNRIKAAVKTQVVALVRILFGDDIDDTGQPFGIMFSRRGS